MRVRGKLLLAIPSDLSDDSKVTGLSIHEYWTKIRHQQTMELEKTKQETYNEYSKSDTLSSRFGRRYAAIGVSYRCERHLLVRTTNQESLLVLILCRCIGRLNYSKPQNIHMYTRTFFLSTFSRLNGSILHDYSETRATFYWIRAWAIRRVQEILSIWLTAPTCNLESRVKNYSDDVLPAAMPTHVRKKMHDV